MPLRREEMQAAQDPGRVLEALRRIATELDSVDSDPARFYRRLSEVIAGLIEARAAAFFLLTGTRLQLQEGAFGIAPETITGHPGIPCSPDGSATADRIVFRGEALHEAPGDSGAITGPLRLGGLGAGGMLAVPWSAGPVRLGLIAAYDAATASGFSAGDLWILQLAAEGAALAWRQRELARGMLATKSEESDRLRAVADQMTELEELKRHVLNLAAHELRGPLAVVRGYISMLADGSLDPAGLRRILPILVGKTAQMDALITQMLEVARLEEGRLELDVRPLDLGQLVRQTVDVAALLAPPGLRVFLELPPDPVVVEGDGERVSTIVGNLVDNAIKYSPGGGLIRCSVRRAAGRALVAVKDPGLGVAPEHLGRLFVRFGRIVTPENSHIGGTGLGLHLSRELARLQGGDIEVLSEPGSGSTFTLWLPLAESAG